MEAVEKEGEKMGGQKAEEIAMLRETEDREKQSREKKLKFQI